MKKTLVIIFGVLLALLIIGAIWFKYNWYKMPGIIASVKNPTHKNRPKMSKVKLMFERIQENLI